MYKKICTTMVFAIIAIAAWAENGAVTLNQSGNACTIRNDFVSVYINKNGEITSLIRYTDNDRNYDHSVQLIDGTGAKGYFSFASGGSNTNYSIKNFYLKVNDGDVVEVQYVTNWPDGINWVIGYIVCRDVPGVYNYAMIAGSSTAKPLSEARMGLRVSPTIFTYGYVNDDVQGMLPTPAQMTVGGTGGCEEVTDATYRLADGTIYTKYNHATFQKDDYVHGLMGNQIGVWMITPSVEWLNGGVMRQDLTLHATNTTPILLRHFHGNHFGGAGVTFGSGQSKYYGPHLIYINQSSSDDVETAHQEMIADAKAQAALERSEWPYSWIRDTNIKARGKVTGQIKLSDDDKEYFKTNKYQVILAQPGMKPMLQGDGYQFWAETDETGNFSIENVRAGNYSLWAYARNGAATGYFEHQNVTVSKNETTELGTLQWEPDKYGEILWQIGEADHLADGYNMSGKKREYAQWNSVPVSLTFSPKTSNETTDFYYAQAHNGTWTISYNLNEVPTYPLRLTIATAGAANAKLTVRSNETTSNTGIGVFRPTHDGSVSRDATLAGRDSIMVVDIPVSQLKEGENKLYLNVWGLGTDNLGNSLGGMMYDCIKLEKSSAPTPLTVAQQAELSFNDETNDNPAGIKDLYNYNATAFYLRGNDSWTIPIRVPGKDTRTFTFSDGTIYKSQNFATLRGQSKNDYTSMPAANATVTETNRLNIGFQTTVPGKIYIAFQSASNPAEGNTLRLAMNGAVVKEASLVEAAEKTARCDVLEYEAAEAGTFFIDAYGAAANVFYVKFVPQGTDGIELTATPQHKGREIIYNLNGQHVTCPTKGLYIVNGRKVLIK